MDTSKKPPYSDGFFAFNSVYFISGISLVNAGIPVISIPVINK
jgi:hypothetical protein